MREVQIGFWVLLVASIVMLTVHPAFGSLAGPSIVLTVLARHGVGWARTTVVAIVGLSTLLQAVLIVVGAEIGNLTMAVVVVALTALLVAVALAMLYHPATIDFYHDRRGAHQ